MENKEKNFASAVIYIHNAEKQAAGFLKTVLEVLEENFEHSEIICVNDFSEDDSVNEIKQISRLAVSASITVLHMSYFHGLEAAMNAGVDLAIGDFVFEFDNTNLDFEKEEIMRVYRHALTNGCDIVSAVPKRRERFSSRMFYKVFDSFTAFSYELHTESFRILSRRVINRVSSMNRTVPYRKAVYASQGLKTDHLAYKPKTCVQAKPDKQEMGYRRGIAVDSLILFTELGYRFSIWMTGIMMVISAFMVIYSIVIFAAAHPVAGWTTTILFLSVAFFGLFGILTIIIKYLQLLVNLLFKRKQYSFEEIEKITK
jgi:dolichol-phosphate mannosyltransferase